MQHENMTVTEVAEYLRKTPATLYAWRHRGIGPRAARLGRTLVYRRADVVRWQEEQYDDGRQPAA